MQSPPSRILIIEHDESFARDLRAMLVDHADAARHIIEAHSLGRALELVKETRFNVILLDFFLPDGAGVPNLELLKSVVGHTPIVVISASDDEAVATECIQAGAQDYLVRGLLNPRRLARAIGHALERQRSEMALREAEERYRSLFDRLVEGIFRTTPDGRYMLANAALAQIYGYASPEELMTTVTDIARRLYVQPGRRAEFRRLMEQHDTITNFESQIYRKDGTTIWISENCHAIRDAQGRLVCYEGTVQDITHRREVEEDLRHSEALYHSLVETLPQNVFRKDMNGCFTFANQQFCKTLGLPLEEILGKTDYDLFPTELAAKYQKDDRKVMESGKAFEAVEEHLPPGKSKLYVQVVKTPLRGGYGQIIGLQGIFWDITAQKEAEEKVRQAQESLRESEALYHSLVDTMPQCIFRKDIEGRYTFANKEFCRTLNRTSEEVIGKTIYDFLAPEIAKQREADDHRVMDSGEPFTQVEESKFLGREDQYIQVLKIPIFDAGGHVVGLQGMFWDITEIKRAEQRIRKANESLAASEEKLRQKNLQMEGDLKMAREIQVAMLPQQYPALPRQAASADSRLQFTHRYLPSGEVGGDFFSVSALSDAEAAVLVCDVAGHGVRSALVTAMIRALVEELRPLAAEPGAFMTKLNSELYTILRHAGSPVLTTAIYVLVNSETGTLRYANAGHPKPLLARRHAGKVDTLANNGRKSDPALGVFPDADYQTSQATLQPGDAALLFTDGIYEVHSAEQELYSRDRLADLVKQSLKLPSPQMLDALLEKVRSFAENNQFDDDVCVVSVDWRGTV